QQRPVSTAHEPRRATAARPRPPGPDEPGRTAARPRRAGGELRRAGPSAARGTARDHRLVAGAGAGRDPLAGALQAGRLVRRELVTGARSQDPLANADEAL